MLKLVLLSLISGSLATGYGGTSGNTGSNSYCYDCHFDPDALKPGSGDSNAQPGYPKCALDESVDESLVDRWTCQSGKCFIRRDPNGLVYRGCADQWKLPWGVDTSKNCEYQGQKPSLYWFCDGHTCNGKKFSEVCSDPPPMPDTAQGGDGDGYTGYMYIYSDDVENFLEPSDWAPEGNGANGEMDGSSAQQMLYPPSSWDTSYQNNNNGESNQQEISYKSQTQWQPPSMNAQPEAEEWDPKMGNQVGAAPQMPPAMGYQTQTTYNGMQQNGMSKPAFDDKFMASLSGQSSSNNGASWQQPQPQQMGSAPWQQKGNQGVNGGKSYQQQQNGMKMPPNPNNGKSHQPATNGKSVQQPANGKNQQQVPQKTMNSKSWQPPQNGKNGQVWQPPNNGKSQQPAQNGYNSKSWQPPSNGKSVQMPSKTKSWQPQPPSNNGKSQMPPAQIGNGKTFMQNGKPWQPPSNGYKSQQQQPSNGYKSQQQQPSNGYKSQQQQPSNGKSTMQQMKSWKQPNGNIWQPQPSNGKSYPPPQNGKSMSNGKPWQPAQNGKGMPNGKPSQPQNGQPNGNPWQPPQNGKPWQPPQNGKPMTNGKPWQPPQNGKPMTNGKPWQPPQNGKPGSNGQAWPPQPANGKSYPQPQPNGAQGAKNQNGKNDSPIDYVHGMNGQDMYEFYYPEDVNVDVQYQYVDGGAADEVYGTNGGADAPEDPWASNTNGAPNGKPYGDPNISFPSVMTSPCDGRCKDNPSGLFPHPMSPKRFIQCGSWDENGESCHCCRPYDMHCPKGTSFDTATKVCTTDELPLANNYLPPQI